MMYGEDKSKKEITSKAYDWDNVGDALGCLFELATRYDAKIEVTAGYDYAGRRSLHYTLTLPEEVEDDEEK